MSQPKQLLRYFYDQLLTVQILEIPYLDSEMSMVIVLPGENKDIAAVAAELTASRIERWLDQLRVQKVDVVLPRFAIEKRYALKRPLQSVGLSHTFRDDANFQGLNKHLEPGTLFLNEFWHQAKLEIDETGGKDENLGRVLTGGAFANAIPFVANRPFLFFIREHESDQMLLMGRLMEPRLEPSRQI